MILFLDFDGVLHPIAQVDETKQGPDFRFAPVLAALLRPYLPRIEIVISSTWGRTRDLDTLRALLPDELADRVTDAVHHHLPPLEEFHLGKGIDSRYAEIAHYLRRRPEVGGDWLALDDDDWDWPTPLRSHLIFAERDLGDPATQERLRAALVARFDRTGDAP